MVKLVKAQNTDRELLLKFMEEYYALYGITFDAEKSAAALVELMADASAGCVWLISVGFDKVGYVVLTLGYSLECFGRDAFIDEFYITAPFRGRGYGRQAIGLVEEAARALDVRELHLEVDRRNHGAQRLYRRLGFGDHDRYLMSKRLS